MTREAGAFKEERPECYTAQSDSQMVMMIVRPIEFAFPVMSLGQNYVVVIVN
jgi:hypothetical protein